MYKVTNTLRRPVFVEGVRLMEGESTSIEKISDGLKHLQSKGIVYIEEVIEKPKETQVLTEEGTSEIKRKRRSSKILNE